MNLFRFGPVSTSTPTPTNSTVASTPTTPQGNSTSINEETTEIVPEASIEEDEGNQHLQGNDTQNGNSSDQ